MSELANLLALGVIVFSITVWIAIWVVLGYFVAKIVDEDPKVGMTYSAALGPLGVVLLIVGHLSVERDLKFETIVQRADGLSTPSKEGTTNDDPLL